jgi:hypothetical protein
MVSSSQAINYKGVSVSDLRELLRGLEVFSADPPALDTSRPPADPHRPLIDPLPPAGRTANRCPGAGWERGRLWT